ncbi:MAG TPA: DUF202 domain-containing protein [Patescibacteria group bacterium]|nr:DUF202 domain-containing protein [Patescibacteria group bacterium]
MRDEKMAVSQSKAGLHQPLTSDELASIRTILAAERTLLAWVRTAMAFISFGFAMIKVLESMAGGTLSSIRPGAGNTIGLFLMFVGTVPLAVGMYQFYKMVQMLGQKPGQIVMNPSFFLAFIILILGVILFFNVTFQWNLV